MSQAVPTVLTVPAVLAFLLIPEVPAVPMVPEVLVVPLVHSVRSAPPVRSGRLRRLRRFDPAVQSFLAVRSVPELPWLQPHRYRPCRPWRPEDRSHLWFPCCPSRRLRLRLPAVPELPWLQPHRCRLCHPWHP